ncbi:MAG: dTMP kinase [Persephonella sp.]|nr:MAG: dTMP kinase [Persephonella sp.]
MNVNRGKFIVFEGIDGSGKTTQAKKLYEYLKEKGLKTVLTKEPGGTDIGKEIRKILLNKDYNIPPIAELLLYEADRNIHISTFVKPKLHNGYVVISDRYIYSTLAYQSFGRGIDRNVVDYLNSLATEDLKPDIVFLLDIPVEEGLNRIGKIRDKDRIEKEDINFHLKLREGFLKLAEENRDIFCIIDGTENINSIFDKILNILKERKLI